MRKAPPPFSYCIDNTHDTQSVINPPSSDRLNKKKERKTYGRERKSPNISQSNRQRDAGHEKFYRIAPSGPLLFTFFIIRLFTFNTSVRLLQVEGIFTKEKEKRKKKTTFLWSLCAQQLAVSGSMSLSTVLLIKSTPSKMVYLDDAGRRKWPLRLSNSITVVLHESLIRYALAYFLRLTAHILQKYTTTTTPQCNNYTRINSTGYWSFSFLFFIYKNQQHETDFLQTPFFPRKTFRLQSTTTARQWKIRKNK